MGRKFSSVLFRSVLCKSSRHLGTLFKNIFLYYKCMSGWKITTYQEIRENMDKDKKG